ncbi:ETS translocation variant 5-like [Oscarella lobularis]|uniref:ETS translocation variant 5-like n=1 Tax=Oscarella lobularis TaxID=121494 RepID=UPI00331389B6
MRGFPEDSQRLSSAQNSASGSYPQQQQQLASYYDLYAPYNPCAATVAHEASTASALATPHYSDYGCEYEYPAYPAYEAPPIKVERTTDCLWEGTQYMDMDLEPPAAIAPLAVAEPNPEQESIISSIVNGMITGSDIDDDESSIFLPIVKPEDECEDCGGVKVGGGASDDDALPTPPYEHQALGQQSPESTIDDMGHAQVDLGLHSAAHLSEFLRHGQDSVHTLMSHTGMPHSPPATPHSPVGTTTRDTPTAATSVASPYLMPPPAYASSLASSVADTGSRSPTAVAVAASAGGGSFLASPSPSGNPFEVKFPKKTGTPLLWQFLLNLLESDQGTGIISWINRTSLEFKITEPTEVAKRWGKIKNRPAMNYEKLSRSLRGYYLKGIMEKVVGEQYAYRFKCHPDVLCMALGARDASTGQPLI